MESIATMVKASDYLEQKSLHFILKEVIANLIGHQSVLLQYNRFSQRRGFGA